MKLLYILNVANRVNSFSYTSMMAAQAAGIDFHIAGNWSYQTEEERKVDEHKYGIHIYQINFIRKPYSLKNYQAFKALIKLIQQEGFDAIHCNTPTGGLLGRLAGKKCGVKKVIYQAHGFHFYKGAPLINWLLYYPVEKLLARYADALIAINREDYELARKRFKLRNHGKVYYVPGVGIDTNLYQRDAIQRKEIRKSIGVDKDEILFISMGDLVARKNYSTAIEAVAKCNNSKVKYTICGTGPDQKRLEALAKKLGVTEQVQFLGYRTDIKNLLHASDGFLLTSVQEGLARSLMEAMASGLPCIASKIRGNTDLLEGTAGGLLYEPTDVMGFTEGISWLANDHDLRHKMGMANLQAIAKFDIAKVEREMEIVYYDALKLLGSK